jgi:hypothetical protein
MDDTYRVSPPGRYIYNGCVLYCPTCRADRGLTFTTSATGDHVTGSCPNGHVWDECSLPPMDLREQAIKEQNRS